MLEILDGFSLVYMIPDVTTYKVSIFTSDYKFLMWVNELLVVDILTQILLTLLTSVAYQFCEKMSICRRWFLYGVTFNLIF